jgi:hypothetical protein
MSNKDKFKVLLGLKIQRSKFSSKPLSVENHQEISASAPPAKAFWRLAGEGKEFGYKISVPTARRTNELA